ncbi:phage protein NinX family protein [Providencia rettgeri]|uniref:DUF2591 domain-containing protein n=1 Tax=Providencia rettgeri TaxID=587 RepID=A0AAE2ZDG1_PRORE|nr:phage protein NinX family protein [Providencia rettgeri]MBW3117874.1 DUF2591 domain-containing protein [Providencia rettgeri]
MNKYNKLSDFEINKKVAERLFLKFTDCYSVVIFEGESFNPCNNPSDAMPIIIENKIASVPQLNGDLWVCSHHPFYVTTNNLYRAAMEVYLLMKDAENEG